MNNIKNRKYARSTNKARTPVGEAEAEFSLSTTAALGILGGTFLIGLVSGKLLTMIKRSCN